MHVTAFRLSVAILLAALALPMKAQAQLTAGDVLLQQEGVLEAGDTTLSNGSLYDECTFEGQAGQAVIITLESEAFDTYLLLVDESGQTLVENDDWHTGTNSTIGYVLPTDGIYQVWANAYAPSGQGAYTVRISLVEPDDQTVLESTADQLNQQGISRYNQSEYPEALALFQQSLAILQTIGHRRGEGATLNNIGFIYDSLGDYPEALDYYQQALAISQEIGDRRNEGRTLNNIGFIYDSLGDYPEALDYYQQALAISQEIGDRRGEGGSLTNIGYTLESLDYPVLAIVYLKQSVNVLEGFRTRHQDLSQEQQQSFTETVAHSYRKLADLLLRQDRVLEAQRVLDLLKVQELDDYLRGLRRETTTESGIDLLPQEAAFLADGESILAKAAPIATELQALRQIPPQERSEAQNRRILELQALQDTIHEQFIAFIDSDQVRQLIAQLSRTAQDQDVITQLNRFPDLQANLEAIGDAVLLYPLILEDRLELVLVTADGPPTRHPVAVSRSELVQAIADFQAQLRDRNSNPQPLAQTLYQWLIADLEGALTATEADTIIYAPDGPLRYIPLTALHDGDQWLAQRYRINQITAASLTKLNLSPSRDPQVLAGAFSVGEYTIEAGDKTLAFTGLPYAGIEVDTLADTFPTLSFLNEKFSRLVTEPLFNDHTIVHLATHAALLIGSPSDSFILFGDGDRLTLEELKRWGGGSRLNRVELVVLSACETGAGSIKDANGEEILGFGYLMQDAGARAVMASLWPVSDGGTQELMTNFYETLKVEGVTKAAALQQAQIALISGNQVDAGSGERFTFTPRNPDSPDALPNSRLSHPYYWAPFILIGNGL